MVIYIYHFLLFKRSLPRVDVEQTSLKGKVEEMIKITKRFLKECSVLDGGGCIPNREIYSQPEEKDEVPHERSVRCRWMERYA